MAETKMHRSSGVSLSDPKTIKALREIAESLEKEREQLIQDRRAAGVFIEEERRKRAKSSSMHR